MAKKKMNKSKKKTTATKKMSRKPAKKVSKKKVSKKTSSKKKKVLAQPKGYHSITPYLIVNEAAKAIEFYKKVFGAKEMMRMEHAGGKIGHAELRIGDAKIMLADEHLEKDARSPQAFGGSPVSIHLYIKDVDGVVQRGLDNGAKLTRPIENMFYGDRSGLLEDPYGHKWCVSTHIEDVTPATVRKRAEELYGQNN